MNPIRKIQMIIWYKNKDGKPDFFVLDRKKGDYVILTGHVADREEIVNESDLQAAIRELKEELGVAPISIVDLQTTIKVSIGKKLLIEHPFLLQINTKNVKFLEANEKHIWISSDKIIDNLTYDSHRQSLKIVLDYFSKIK